MRSLGSHAGYGFPGPVRRAVHGIRLRFAAGGPYELRIEHPTLPEMRLVCSTIAAYNRAMTAYANEPGTVRWLLTRICPGDVVHDIGANVGIYTLMAAEAVGADGHVCAFEPHAATVVDLLRNVSANQRGDRVTVLSVALHDHGGFLPFRYRSLEAASGLSQLDEIEDPWGRSAVPVASELKSAATLDELVDADTVRRPDLVKIDVDGNELRILWGMERQLRGRTPRSIQVEVNPRGGEALLAFVTDCGYELVERHHTLAVQRREQAGQDVTRLPYNAIFDRIE